MTQRNIHGNWSMDFEGRILKSKITGSTNKEANVAWLEELQQKILSSPVSEAGPWVALIDARDWGMASQDA